jgi:UDP-N-acetylglucosamine diphosphorylase / glucose-1-phosphate thymidylyltransferase / UDP-N-acetylgalactosamine diphosphorylase / glucosamine-1-phosphate N-acetyltransferase / galactosamine-1-phosphate N-acetyltransferase
MAVPDIILYDDARARAWQPLTLLRPAGELRLGAWTFRERAERLLNGRCAGHLANAELAGFEEPGAPPVLRAGDVARDRSLLYLNARVLLEPPRELRVPERSGPIHVGDRVAGWIGRPGEPIPDVVHDRAAPDAAPVLVLAGRWLDNVWELVAGNAAQIASDFETAGGANASPPAGVAAIGEARLRLGRDVAFEPHVVLDFRAGPIWLEDGVRVRAFSRLAGPIHVARESTLLGGACTAVSIGPHCKIRGEIEDSVVLGYSNKAHDGFIGHAYLGAWVNLGALTTNSDLKNNYGTIRIWTPDGDVDTGSIKLGCLVGDHVKTGIGMLLNTGTVIGAGSNLWGAELPPKYVPPFSWGSGENLDAYDIERFLATAAVVMRRRNVALTDGMKAMLRQVFEQERQG